MAGKHFPIKIGKQIGKIGSKKGPVRGPDVSSRQFFFRTKKIEGPKFHVMRTSDSRKIKSLITSPTPSWRCTLPRTLARFYSPLRAGISRFRDVVACRLPRGVPLHCRNFLFLTPGCTTPCKPHTKDDIFPLRSTKSPSHALNLVGRWLLPGKTCSRHPSSTRPRVGLLLLAAPADRACAISFEVGGAATMPSFKVGASKMPSFEEGGGKTMPLFEIGGASKMPSFEVGGASTMPSFEVGGASTMPLFKVGASKMPFG